MVPSHSLPIEAPHINNFPLPGRIASGRDMILGPDGLRNRRFPEGIDFYIRGSGFHILRIP